MKKFKRIIPIIIAFIIGISTTVTAATIFRSEDITYESDKTDATNVKDSLDELYTKIGSSGNCPDGNLCRDSLVKNVQLGDYISMTPTATTYTISKSLTGYTDDQTINPSELNLWRVISKNSDGSVDVVSEYVSSTKVYFTGRTGYMNFVGALNTIAAQYTNTKYVSKTRHIGYSNQIETCTGTLSATSCPTDTGYENDINAIQNILGSLKSKTPSGDDTGYWVASRNVGASTYKCRGVGKSQFDGSFELGSTLIYPENIYGTGTTARPNVRPILTLKANIGIVSGDGKSAETAYQLA